MTEIVILHRDELSALIKQAVSEALTSTEPQAQSTEKKEFLNVREAAAFLKVSEGSIRNWEKDGLLKSTRWGKRILFDRATLERPEQQA